MKTTVICFTNNKGGSGKSTVCANLGYELAASGKRVLLVDGDMQMNLTLSFFSEEETISMARSGKTLYEAVCDKADLADFIVPTKYDRLDLVPSSSLMSQIEFRLFTMMQREFVLAKCLSGIREKGTYDYILIDAPPTLGNWVINILAASDHSIMPVEASPWGLFGLANMFDLLDSVSGICHVSLLGIVITKVDERKKYYRQTCEVLSQYPDIPVFKTVIHVDSAVEWAEDNSVPVSVFRKTARSAVEFRQLSKEIINYNKEGTHGSRKKQYGKSIEKDGSAGKDS
jgi:chromosome partitioning protein